jgi:hypothetical protein
MPGTAPRATSENAIERLMIVRLALVTALVHGQEHHHRHSRNHNLDITCSLPKGRRGTSGRFGGGEGDPPEPIRTRRHRIRDWASAVTRSAIKAFEP